MKKLSNKFDGLKIKNQQIYDDNQSKKLLKERDNGEYASIETLTFLLENKADPNFQNHLNETPLHFLCQFTTPAFLEKPIKPIHNNK